MLKLTLGAIACACFFVGCSSAPRGERQLIAMRAEPSGRLANVLGALSTASDKTGSELNEEERKSLEALISDLESTCADKLSGMEKDARAKAQNSFWLSIAGAVAGSVIAPALTVHAATNAGAIAGLSGFAGATNFMSQSLTSTGNSGSADATTRNQIVTDVKSHLADAFNEQKTVGDRMDAVYAAKAACTFYGMYVPSVTSYTAPGAADSGK